MLCLFASGIQNAWFMDRPQAHLVGLTQLWDWGEKRFFKIVSWYDNECLALNLSILLCGTNPRCCNHDGIFNLMSTYDWLKFFVRWFLSTCWGGATATGLSTCWCTWLRPKNFPHTLCWSMEKINGMLWPVRIITWKRLFSRLPITFCAPQDHSRKECQRRFIVGIASSLRVCDLTHLYTSYFEACKEVLCFLVAHIQLQRNQNHMMFVHCVIESGLTMLHRFHPPEVCRGWHSMGICQLQLRWWIQRVPRPWDIEVECSWILFWHSLRFMPNNMDTYDVSFL